jgi:hypothetical protein
MLCMTQDFDPPPPDPPPPSDVCLLLRAHAEQRWLSLEVGPVLRQLRQRDSLPEEQLGAALAYLEVLWIEASERAAETDAAYAQLEASERAAKAEAADAEADASPASGGWTLPSKARRYRVAVLTLRDVFGRQVAALLAMPDAAREHANS